MKLSYIGVLSRTEFDSSIQFLNFGLGSEKNDWNDAKIGLSWKGQDWLQSLPQVNVTKKVTSALIIEQLG